jgi:hypothetical protein
MIRPSMNRDFRMSPPACRGLPHMKAGYQDGDAWGSRTNGACVNATHGARKPPNETRGKTSRSVTYSPLLRDIRTDQGSANASPQSAWPGLLTAVALVATPGD